ncbi:hypothetical protein JCM10449v2_007983 [Rhodotorula kratochvilovae]
MGTQPAPRASAPRAAAPSPAPTSHLVPSPSLPLHTASQTAGDAFTAAAHFQQRNGGDGAAHPAERAESFSPSLDRRGAPKGLEKRPRTRERRHAPRAAWDEAAQDGAELVRRQWQIPQAEGYPSCYYVDLSVFTCYPESNTTLVQDNYSLAIWNSAQPSFISRGYVDVHLYNADTQDVATSWRNESNAAGMIGIVPDDPWWPGGQTVDEWFGADARNRSTPYFFVVVPAGDDLTGGEVHGATFTAIQTAAPGTLSAALAAMTTSSLSSASSASLASLSSLSSLSAISASSASSLSSASESSPTRARGGPSSLQDPSSGGSSLPKYAIALIVVLGTLALLAGALAVFCCLGRARRRRRQEAAARHGGSSGDFTEAGSAEPMLAGAAVGAGAGVGAGSAATRGSRASSGLAPPIGLAAAGAGAGAAAGGKDAEKAEDDATLSQSDAARMAAAFRAALRKPEYEAPPVPSSPGAGPGAGPSPTGAQEGTDSSGSGAGDNEAGRGIMEEELRSEGKSMRSVEGGGKRWGRGV